MYEEFKKKLKDRCGTINDAVFGKTYHEYVTSILEPQYEKLITMRESIPEKIKETGFELFCAAYKHNLALYEFTSDSNPTSRTEL
jgi:hypothetical protein